MIFVSIYVCSLKNKKKQNRKKRKEKRARVAEDVIIPVFCVLAIAQDHRGCYTEVIRQRETQRETGTASS